MFRTFLGLFRPQEASPGGSRSPFGYGRPIRNRLPPNKPGHYRFTDTTTGKVDRYGTTKNLSRRYGEYKRNGLFDPDRHIFEYQIAKHGITSDDLYAHEKKKIKKHSPRLNQRNGGGGPRW